MRPEVNTDKRGDSPFARTAVSTCGADGQNHPHIMSKGHRYLLCVVDHDTGRLVWAAKGRDSETLRRFFDALGAQRSALLTHISADGAEWIHTVATERAPQAVLCLDAFHVVAWATAAVDAVRRSTCNQLRQDGKTDQAAALKNSRWALLKNPPDLTGDQRTTVAAIAKTNLPLYRAYLLKDNSVKSSQPKEPGADSYSPAGCPGPADPASPSSWHWPKLSNGYLPLIHNTLDHGVSNALSEATNTHLRLLTRRAYGYHSADALIAMATLTRGGLCPPLPGRS